MDNTSIRRARWGAAGLILIALFGANLARVRSLGMDDLPPFWVVDAIPPALSNLVFHSPSDHASLAVVSSAFYASLQGNAPYQPRDTQMIGRAIAAVRALDPGTIARDEQLMSGDDKGIVDFVKIAFALFGYRSDRIIYLYFLVLFVSISLLIFCFRASPLPPIIAGAFLTAHFMLLPAVFYNLQLRSVLAPRFLPVLGLVACLHCLFFAFRPSSKPSGVAGLILQAAVLIFAMHLRSVAIWEIALVGIVSVAMFAANLVSPASQACARSRWAPLLPAALLVLGMAGLSEYRQLTYNRHYLNGDVMATRPFWHNILSGFAINPVLAAQYGFKVDDSSEVRATGRYLTQHGRGAEWAAMGGTPMDRPWVWSAVFSRLRLGDYDHAARGLILSIVVHQPGEVLATYLYYKPRSLWNHLAWIYGFRRNIPDVAIYVSPDVGEAMATQLADLQATIDHRHMRFLLLNPVGVAVVLAFALLLSSQADRLPWRDWAPLAVLAGGALIPATIGYAGMHTISEPALMLAVAIYVAATAALARLLTARWNHRKPGRAGPRLGKS